MIGPTDLSSANPALTRFSVLGEAQLLKASLRSLTVKPLHTRMARRRFTVVYR